MNSLRSVAALVVIFAAQAAVHPSLAQSPQPAFVPGELLVGYASREGRNKAAQELGAVKDTVRSRGQGAASVEAQSIGEKSLKLRIDLPNIRGRASDELATLKGIATELRNRDKTIQYAHPNWIFDVEELPPRVPMDLTLLDAMATTQSVPTTRSVPNDGGPDDYAYVHGLHWHYAAPPLGMNAAAAWKLEKGSRDVVVAVLDTGLLLDHPDIQNSGNVLPGYNMVRPKRGPDPTDPGDACPPSKPVSSWHGTHVAGTIGAIGSNNGRGATGVNWSVSVLPVRVFGYCGHGTVEDIADAVRWAAALSVPDVPAEQNNKHPAHVINMSLGIAMPCTEEMTYLAEAIGEARANGTVIVASAGNDHRDVHDYSPAGCKGVITVTASNREGHLASYSNYGAVTIMAPGGEWRISDEEELKLPRGVWSVVQVNAKNREGIEAMPGTSMAAPHVSGAIALAFSRHPDWRGKPDLIEKKLRESASPIIAGACPSPCGVGQLDAAKLIEVR